jgi:hypothetical protein
VSSFHFFRTFLIRVIKCSKMNDQNQVSLNRLAAIGLPTLWPSHINAWFTQAEAFFDLRKITSDYTKINYVILSLSSDLVQEVYDILSTKYEVYSEFKDALIKRFSKSKQERICQLLTAEELGDRTPSELLRRMQALVTDSALETGIFRQIFLQKLPPHVREILASISDDTPLVNLASIADKILVVRKHELPSAVTSTIATSSHSDLQSQINSLTARLDRLVSLRSRSSSRRPARSRSRSRHSHRCWYHSHFGPRARKCVPPCDFNKPKNSEANP